MHQHEVGRPFIIRRGHVRVGRRIVEGVHLARRTLERDGARARQPLGIDPRASAQRDEGRRVIHIQQPEPARHAGAAARQQHPGAARVAQQQRAGQRDAESARSGGLEDHQLVPPVGPDGDDPPVLQRQEPAEPEVPQRSARVGIRGGERLHIPGEAPVQLQPLQVPATVRIGQEREFVRSGPLGLQGGDAVSPGDDDAVGDGTIGHQPADGKGRRIPRHVRVIPREPGEPSAPRRGIRHEVRPADHHREGAGAIGGRAVERHDHDVADRCGAVRVRLAHREEPPVGGGEVGEAHPGVGGGQGFRRAAEPQQPHPLVGVLDEHQIVGRRCSSMRRRRTPARATARSTGRGGEAPPGHRTDRRTLDGRPRCGRARRVPPRSTTRPRRRSARRRCAATRWRHRPPRSERATNHTGASGAPPQARGPRTRRRRNTATHP